MLMSEEEAEEGPSEAEEEVVRSTKQRLSVTSVITWDIFNPNAQSGTMRHTMQRSMRKRKFC